MTTVPNRAPTYPIPPDDRLTDDLVGLVADLLTHHGYPFIDGADLDRLREALRLFLFISTWRPGAPAEFDAEHVAATLREWGPRLRANTVLHPAGAQYWTDMARWAQIWQRMRGPTHDHTSIWPSPLNAFGREVENGWAAGL